MAEEDFFSLLLSNHIGGGSGMPPDEQCKMQQFPQRQHRLQLQQLVMQQSQQRRCERKRSSSIDGRFEEKVSEGNSSTAFRRSIAIPGLVEAAAGNVLPASAETWQRQQGEHERQRHLQRQGQHTEIGSSAEHQHMSHPHACRGQNPSRHRQRLPSKGAFPCRARDPQPSSHRSSRSNSSGGQNYSNQTEMYCSSRLSSNCSGPASHRSSSSSSSRRNRKNRGTVGGMLKGSSRQLLRKISAGPDGRERGKKQATGSARPNSNSINRYSSKNSSNRRVPCRSRAIPWKQQSQQSEDGKIQREIKPRQQRHCQRVQQQEYHSDCSICSKDSVASLISRSRRLLLGDGSTYREQHRHHTLRKWQQEQLLQQRRLETRSRSLQCKDIEGRKGREENQQSRRITSRSSSCRSPSSTNSISRTKNKSNALNERCIIEDSSPQPFYQCNDEKNNARPPEQQQKLPQGEEGQHFQQQHGGRGSNVRGMEDAVQHERLLLQQEERQRQQLKELHAQQQELQQQQLDHQMAEKLLMQKQQQLQQKELALHSRQQRQQQHAASLQRQQGRLTAAAAAVGSLQQQLQLLRVLLQHNIRDAARWMESSLLGFKSICDRQVGAVASAAAEAAAAHDQQKQQLQQSITLLELELQRTAGAMQQQEKLVETLRAQQDQEREAAAVAAAQQIEERLKNQHSMHQQHLEQIQELQVAHQKQQEAQQQHQRELQDQLLQQQQAANHEREKLQQKLQEAQEALETLRLQREDERAEKDKQQRAEAAELRRLKESNILLLQKVQQQEQQIQQQQQQLTMLQEQAEKDAQHRQEQQQQQEQQMLQAVQQLNAAASHKEARLQSLQREKEADKLQLERERQMVLLQSEELEEARKRLSAAASLQQQQQQALHEQHQQLLRLQRKHQQQNDEVVALQQQLQQLQQQNEAAEREHEERYARLQAESSQRLQQLLLQEQQLRREVAAQRELLRKGNSSTDELLLAKHELNTLKHELQDLLAEETGKRETLQQQNEQQRQQIATKQQLLRCLMQEKAALEAQLSQLQQQQQQQKQQYEDACKQHLAQTLKLQQQSEAEQQRVEHLQDKLEQQQQQLLLQQQKLDFLARQNEEKQQQLLLLQREEAALHDRLDSEAARANKLKDTLSAAQQTVQQQRQQLLLLQKSCMRGGEQIDEDLLKQTSPGKHAEAQETSAAVIGAAPGDAVDPRASSVSFECIKVEQLPRAFEADAQTVDGTAEGSKHSLVASRLQKLPLEALDISKAKDKQQQQGGNRSEPSKQNRQSSADTCDTEAHADCNSSSCSFHAVAEEQRSSRCSSNSSIRTSSATSDSSNCSYSSNTKCKNSPMLLRQRAKSTGSASSSRGEENQQQPLQPGDTPRFGPAAYLLHKLTSSSSPCDNKQEQKQQRQVEEASAGSRDMERTCGTRDSSGDNHLAMLQLELNGLRRSTFAARKRMRQLQQQRQDVRQQRQSIETQQKQRQQEEAEVYELLAQQSCCCEIAYQDLLQQSARFAAAVRNKQRLEVAAAVAAAGDPESAGTESVPTAAATTAGDAARCHFGGLLAASHDADKEEALRILLATAGRDKVCTAIQYWAREASSAKWILQRAHAERDTAANIRQNAQQKLQQLQQQADERRRQVQKLKREELALQSEEALCRDELLHLANKEQQLLLQFRQGSGDSSRNRSRFRLSTGRTHSSSLSGISKKNCTGGNRSASAEPLTRSSCSRAKCSALPHSSTAATACDMSSSSNKGWMALKSLQKLLQQHNLLSSPTSLMRKDPDMAAVASAMDTEHCHNKGCSFWVQLEESAGL